eukprot:GHVR01159734.1.p2 GENE.GHVR01159734.1~~GHVR01159734.1.p2  ORF type:complete len:104 (-),score=3.43 GHVR01159734.1:701-1012(-)
MHKCFYIYAQMLLYLCTNAFIFMHKCFYIYAQMLLYLCTNAFIFMHNIKAFVFSVYVSFVQVSNTLIYTCRSTCRSTCHSTLTYTDRLSYTDRQAYPLTQLMQ